MRNPKLRIHGCASTFFTANLCKDIVTIYLSAISTHSGKLSTKYGLKLAKVEFGNDITGNIASVMIQIIKKHVDDTHANSLKHDHVIDRPDSTFHCYVAILMVAIKRACDYALLIAPTVLNAEDESARTAGKMHMLYGIIGLLIILSAYAILKIAAGTFGISV